MSFHQNLKLIFLTSSLIAINICSALTDHIKVVGEKTVKVIVNEPINNNGQFSFNNPAPSKTKEITLLDVELDEIAKSELKKRMNNLLKERNTLSYAQTAPEGSINKDTNKFTVDLGMSDVPVLDQGTHGTCATFAVTAAIDALHNVGDYISQQCLLEIGLYKYYFFQTYSPGWDGGYVENVIGRIKYYGVVNKNNCPHSYPNKDKWMFPYTYWGYSLNEPWIKNVNWKRLPTANLHELKKALNNGNRVVIDNILYLKKVLGYPINGKNNGLWDIPESREEFVEMMDRILWYDGSLGKHSIVVTGYDDAKKLLKIRNSWGESYGDQGEFYMSYDFYKLFNTQALEIYSSKY